MKIVVFLFLSAVACQLTYAAYLDDFRVTDLAIRSISDKFKKALENLKEIIKSGNATIGIPILDPFYLAHKEINAVNNIFTGTIAVTNFNLDGLSTYIVRNADFKIAKWNITVDFLWPNVKGKTAYDVQGHALDKILVYGSGDLYYEINNFYFSTQAKLKVNFKTKEVSISSFSSTKISIEDIKIKITGLFNDDEISELASAVISELIPDTIVDFQEEITKFINQSLKENANTFLKNYTLDDIMGLLH